MRILALLTLLIPTSPLFAEETVRAEDSGSRILVETPSRELELYVDPAIGSLRGAKIEIPLSSLREKNPAVASQPSTVVIQTQQPTPPIAAPPVAPAPAATPQVASPPMRPIDELLKQANNLYFEKKIPQALKTVDEILQREPTQVRALLMKGSLIRLSGSEPEAKKAWDRARELDPTHPGVLSIPGGPK